MPAAAAPADAVRPAVVLVVPAAVLISSAAACGEAIELVQGALRRCFASVAAAAGFAEGACLAFPVASPVAFPAFEQPLLAAASTLVGVPWQIVDFEPLDEEICQQREQILAKRSLQNCNNA